MSHLEFADKDAEPYCLEIKCKAWQPCTLLVINVTKGNSVGKLRRRYILVEYEICGTRRRSNVVLYTWAYMV